MVHVGFEKIWNELRPGVERAFDQHGCKDRAVQMTGFSMGGAIASMAAFDLVSSGHNVEKLYTFGEAPSGNPTWANARESLWKKKHVQYFRVTNYKDNVPLGAFATSSWWYRSLLHSGYAQAGPEVYYFETKLGSYNICQDGHDNECSLRWCSWLTGCDRSLGRNG